MRWLDSKPGTVFTIFVGWKLALLLFTVQPIPSNDAYFYDGAVVNLLNGGAFINPSIAIGRPYSGTEFFSPYPPLYQGVLLGWMKVFGTSARSAVGLHVFLMVMWSGLIYQILRRIETPVWVMHLAGGFLFTITFHDRPDTVAHVLGAAAILAMVGWLRSEACRGLLWGSGVLLALVFCTSLQIGATYTAVIGIAVLARCWLGKVRVPWANLVAMGLTPFALLALGKLGFPHWWTGFLESAQDNPSASGLHLPGVDALLKAVRSLPGFLAVLGMSVWGLPRMRPSSFKFHQSQLALFLGAVAGTLGVCILGLFYLTENYIPAFAAFLQPLAVGAGLAWLGSVDRLCAPRPIVLAVGCLAIALGGVRALGMTTWGLLCARDVSYEDACGMVADELRASSPFAEQPVVLSAAYLYGAVSQTNLHLIHSDYVVRPRGRATESDLVGLNDLKPSRLVLTQFDYYRRYEPVLAELRRTRGDVVVRITNRARVPSPDAKRLTRKLVQHVAWAPVIVELEWPKTDLPK